MEEKNIFFFNFNVLVLSDKCWNFLLCPGEIPVPNPKFQSKIPVQNPCPKSQYRFQVTNPIPKSQSQIPPLFRGTAICLGTGIWESGPGFGTRICDLDLGIGTLIWNLDLGLELKNKRTEVRIYKKKVRKKERAFSFFLGRFLGRKRVFFSFLLSLFLLSVINQL